MTKGTRMSIQSHRRRIAAVALASATLAAGGGAVAFAHTEEVSEDPANGSKVGTNTSKATITFGEQIKSGKLVVRGPKGVVSRTSRVSTTNVKKLYATLKRPLAKGRYRATWNVTAADGHKQEGSWTFRVG